MTGEKISHLNEKVDQNENVKNNTASSEVAQDVAMKLTMCVVEGGVTGVSNVVAENLMKEFVEGSSSDTTATSIVETETFSDTSVVDESIDDSSSFLDIIYFFFFC